MRLGKKMAALAVVLVVAYFIYGRFFGAPTDGMGGMPGGAPPVSVAEAIEREVQLWHEFSGRLVAVETVEIRPRVSGTIDKIHFQEGARVSKGDPLFTIDPRPFQAALQAAQARATLAASELQRAESLLADKAIPQKDYDQRKNAAEVAKADLTRAKLDLDYTLIRSPVSGRASRAEITPGNLVDAGGNAPVLTTVVSDRPIYADFDIDEQTFLQYLQSVASETTALRNVPVALGLSGQHNTPYQGHVQSFDNQLDVRSGTIRVRAIFDNKDGTLVPGLFARVLLGSANPVKAILITDRAVGTDQNKKFVLVVSPDNKTERREIKLGDMADNLRIVTDGLKPGEKIVVSGTQRVMMPGQPVTPELVPMDAPPAPAAGRPEAPAQPETAEDEPKAAAAQ